MQQPLCATLLQIRKTELMLSDAEITAMEEFVAVMSPIVADLIDKATSMLQRLAFPTRKKKEENHHPYTPQYHSREHRWWASTKTTERSSSSLEDICEPSSLDDPLSRQLAKESGVLAVILSRSLFCGGRTIIHRFQSLLKWCRSTSVFRLLLSHLRGHSVLQDTLSNQSKLPYFLNM